MLQGAHEYRLAGYAVPEGAPDKPRGNTSIILKTAITPLRGASIEVIFAVQAS